MDKLSIKPKNIVILDKALLVFHLFRNHILETWFLFIWYYILRSPNREYCDLLPVTINDNWRNWLKTPIGFIRNWYIFLLGTGAKSITAEWRESGAIYQLTFDQNVLSHNVKFKPENVLIRCSSLGFFLQNLLSKSTCLKLYQGHEWSTNL